MIGERTEAHDARRIDITEYLHLSVVGYHQSQGKTMGSGSAGGNDRLLVPIPGQTAPPAPVPLPPSIEEFDRMREISAAYQQQQQQQQYMYAREGENHAGILDHEYMTNAYDLEDEQYDEFLPSTNVQDADGDEMTKGKSQSLAQALSISQLNNQSNNNGNVPEDYEGAAEAMDYYEDNVAGDGISGQHSEVEQNPFDEQQQAREMEFMGQLCAPMVDAPQEIYQYVEAEMWDRLHRTVGPLIAQTLVLNCLNYHFYLCFR
jgi:hypothetical protein